MNKALAEQLSRNAPMFAALGDPTRLSLLVRLGDGESHSVTHLSRESSLTRQAIRKHLRVLEKVGMVHSAKRGRETLFEYDPKPVEQLKLSLDDIARQWDQTLARLKTFVENE